MIQKRIDQIEVDDLQGLVENGVREGKSMEYKQQLPGATDADKKEFLADISSFANASGGTVVFGVIEGRDANGKASGVPESIAGLANVNADTEVRRLEQMIRDGLEPRIPGIGLKAIDGFPDGPVIVIQIPQSWAAPHMVAFKSSPRFFSRTSAGKSPLNVPEIRAAFIQSESLPQRIREFRSERLGLISAGETPVALYENAPVIILHLIPISAFLNPPNLDVAGIMQSNFHFPPLGLSGFSYRLNSDGFVSFSGGRTSRDFQAAYSQLFRNGIVEGVNAELVSGNDEGKYFQSVAFEERIIQTVRHYLDLMRRLQLESSFVVMLSLLGVQGCFMYTSPRYNFGERHSIEKRNLILPDILVNEQPTDSASMMRPIFDMVWQACGYPRSLNYDEQGNWKPRQ